MTNPNEARAERAVRWYRRLLALYPRDFRDRFGDSAAQVFRERYQEEQERPGRVGLLLFWARTLANVALHGPLERGSDLADRFRPRPGGWNGAGADLAAALRTTRRSLRHNVAAILCIGLGIAATSAILTLVSSTLLRPLPFPDADRLVRIWGVEENVERAGRGQLSYPDLEYLAASVTTLDPLVFTGRSRQMFQGEAGARRVEGEAISPGYLELLGVEPFLGRLFGPDDYRPSSPATMLLAFSTWTREYGADPQILGTDIQTARGRYTVIGVLPQDFLGTIEDDIPELEFWVPIEHHVREAERTRRDIEFVWTVGRLVDGRTLAEARSELEALGVRLSASGLADDHWNGYWVEAFGENWRADLRWRSTLLLGAAALLLLVAATNVAGLLVARTMSRRRELAVRAAIGADPRRLVRQTLFETLVVTAIGGGVGVALSPWLLGVFMQLAPDQLPAYLTLAPDVRSLLLAGGVILLVALVAGTTPALLSSRVGPASALSSGGRSATLGRAERKTSRWLVIGEIALTTVLISTAALLVQSYRALGAVDVGFRAEGLVKLAIFVNEGDVADDAELPEFYDRLRQSLMAEPGVERVALVAPTLPPGFSWEARFRFDGMAPSAVESGFLSYLHMVDSEFLPTLGIPVVAGRNVDRTDTRGTGPVAVVSESMAERLGGPEAAVGRTVQFDSISYTVVGVARDVLYFGAVVRRPENLDVYIPLEQAPARVVSIAVETAGDPGSLIVPLQARLGRLAPRSPLDWIATMPQDLAGEFQSPRFYMVLLAAFATAALLLTGLGVFAALANQVARQRPEMGIRRAFGAHGSHLLTSVMKRGVGLCVVGLGIGVVGALLVGTVLGRTLYGVGVFDLRAVGVATLVVLVAGAAASYVPALRATRISPLEAMRE